MINDINQIARLRFAFQSIDFGCVDPWMSLLQSFFSGLLQDIFLDCSRLSRFPSYRTCLSCLSFLQHMYIYGSKLDINNKEILQWFNTILIPMLLGFAVFMCGMKLMELALHRLAGPYLTRMLERSTATPIHGLAIGTATTAFLQSSTAVTVIAIGMVNAGLLTFPRTLGIILGTNIGTCITTELIGLNLNKLAVAFAYRLASDYG